MDYANLQYYREPHKIGPQVNGYLAELADFQIQLIYKPGSANRADALSRRPDQTLDEETEMTIVLPDYLFVNPQEKHSEFQTT